MRASQIILLPVAFLFGIITLIRNWLYTCSFLRSKQFDIGVISVGNLSVGGTGKTPHIEYLIRLLQQKFFIATLSRGYKRRSKGFILASRRSNVKYIGDEPMQYVKKYPDLKVAVDEKRVNGIKQLLQRFPALQVVLLDDAFQHRRIKPGLSILLTDYHNLYVHDYIIPSGTLREFACGSKRADIIIVTKTPKIFSPITRRRILDELKPKPFQKVFFSYIQYLEPVPVNPDRTTIQLKQGNTILLVTGIANDYPLCEHLNRFCRELVRLKFPDHHTYTKSDLKKIKTTFDDLPTKNKVIFTTEKDLTRLKTPELKNFLQPLPLFYIPIEVDFHGEGKKEFDQIILNYVAKNSGDSRIFIRKNQPQT